MMIKISDKSAEEGWQCLSPVLSLYNKLHSRLTPEKSKVTELCATRRFNNISQFFFFFKIMEILRGKYTVKDIVSFLFQWSQRVRVNTHTHTHKIVYVVYDYKQTTTKDKWCYCLILLTLNCLMLIFNLRISLITKINNCKKWDLCLRSLKQ